MTPDSRWLDFLKMLFGFGLLAILGGLANRIALGHVEAGSSFGLGIILGGVRSVLGGFVGWAFREKGEKPESTLKATPEVRNDL